MTIITARMHKVMLIAELHKAERRAEQATELLRELYKAACGSPHLQEQHGELQRRVRALLCDPGELQRRVQAFLHDLKPKEK